MAPEHRRLALEIVTKRLDRPKFSDGDRQKLGAALDSGRSWHAASLATKIAYSTVKKHARLMG